MDKFLHDAIEEYERNIDSSNNFYMDAETLMDIEEYYEKEGRLFDADRLLSYAEKIHPQHEEVLIVKAYRLKNKGKWNEALTVISDVNNRENRDVQALLAEWEAAGGNPKKAEERMMQHLPLVKNEEYYEWFIDLSEILLDYGYTKRAQYFLQQIPEDHKSRAKTDELLAESYFQFHDFKKSMDYLTRVVDTNIYDAASWSQLANLQMKLEEYENCIASCDYSLAIKPGNEQTLSLKLFALFHLNRTNEGFKFYKQYADTINEDYSFHMYAAEQYLVSEQYQPALEAFHEALRLCPMDNPDRSRLICATAYAYAFTGQNDNAQEIMLTLSSLGSLPNDIHFQLATIFYETRQPLAVIEEFEAILKGNHTDKERLQIVQTIIEYYNTFKTSELYIPKSKELLHLITDEPITNIETVSIYAFEAVAFYLLRDKEYLLKSLRLASEHCPVLLHAKLYPFTGKSHLEESLNCIIDEAEHWDTL